MHLDDIGVNWRPKNHPAGIPIWVGSAVDGGVRWAAEIGDAWISAGAMTRNDLTRWWGMFDDTCKALGKVLTYPRQVAGECFCAPDMKTATALAAGPLSSTCSRYAGNGWGAFDACDGDALAAFARDRFAVGDAAFVHDEPQRYRDQHGATELRFRIAWPGVRQGEVLGSIRRFGRLAAEPTGELMGRETITGCRARRGPTKVQ